MLFDVKKPEECNLMQQESLKLWHERLGRINVKSIRETEEAGAVGGMKIKAGNDFFCEACVMGSRFSRLRSHIFQATGRKLRNREK